MFSDVRVENQVEHLIIVNKSIKETENLIFFSERLNFISLIDTKTCTVESGNCAAVEIASVVSNCPGEKGKFQSVRASTAAFLAFPLRLVFKERNRLNHAKESTIGPNFFVMAGKV